MSSVLNLGILLFLGGLLATWVEIGIVSDWAVGPLFLRDPLGVLAPLTLIVVGSMCISFGLFVRRRSDLGSRIANTITVLAVGYGTVATVVLITHVISSRSFFGASFGAGVVVLYVAWLALCYWFRRYLNSLVETKGEG